jgi:hypothetical protein
VWADMSLVKLPFLPYGSLPVACCWLAVAALDPTYAALLMPDSVQPPVAFRRAKRDLTIPVEQQHPRGEGDYLPYEVEGIERLQEVEGILFGPGGGR